MQFLERERFINKCRHVHWTIQCSHCKALVASEITAQQFVDEQIAVDFLLSTQKYKVVKVRKKVYN